MSTAVHGTTRRRPWFAWKPTVDTAVAALSVIVWTVTYYLQALLQDEPWHTLFGLAATVAIVVGPIWWLCWHRGRPLADLGITTRRWRESLIISIAIGGIFLWIVLAHYGGLGLAALGPHLVANAFVFWEPFFVFGWLGLQFGRAFGLVPGVILAGVSQGLYHLGTYPISMVVTFALFGILFCAIFRLTDNLLSLWPLAWASVCAMGTLVGGNLFSWSDVAAYGAAVVLQLFVIAWTWRSHALASGGAPAAAGSE
jgi:hypothetical protein